MDLEEGGDGGTGGGGGFFPRLFYDVGENDVGMDQGQGVDILEPHECFMDRPGAVPPEKNCQGRRPGQLSYVCAADGPTEKIRHRRW